MKKLDIDYAVTAKPYPFWMRLGLLLLAIGVAMLVTLCYQSSQAALAGYQAKAGLHVEELTNSPANVDEAMRYAKQTQRSLTYPWLQLLSHLEAVKQSHPNVGFLNVAMNKTTSEMRLEGEAKTFAEITSLLNDLKADASFQDAVLVNQYLVEPDSQAENNGKPLYTFNMLLKWWP